MINFVEMILMGIVATLFMDMLAVILAESKIIHPLIKPEAVGRWNNSYRSLEKPFV